MTQRYPLWLRWVRRLLMGLGVIHILVWVTVILWLWGRGG